MKVDYLIIGAGLAGITLKHFLKNDRTVVVDPNPGAYKVGESFMNLWDRPYPLDDRGRALFDALESAIRSQQDEWMALKP